MLKQSILYGCVTWVILLLVSCGGKEELPSLTESYSYKESAPFGTQVMYRQMNYYFYRNDIQVRRTDLVKSLATHYEDSSSLYIDVSRNFFVTKDEMNTLFTFVSNGNTAFIASQNIDSAFLKELGLEQGDEDNSPHFLFSLDYTSLKLQPAIFNDSNNYAYYYLPFGNIFSKYPEEKAKILGTNKKGSPNFIVVFYGRGRFYIHCEPRAFSNYFLLQHKNYQYLQQAFSFVPAVPEHVYWDDYYNKRNYPPSDKETKSGLAVLWQYPAMAWALSLVIALLLLFILFDSKRRQRIIKPLQPNTNTSVAFTETVSRLYLQKKDNKNIADKMITFFFEQVRNQYFLHSNQLDEAFTDTLSRKANVPKEDVAKLFGSISWIQQSVQISDHDLLTLNQQIQNFFKHKT